MTWDVGVRNMAFGRAWLVIAILAGVIETLRIGAVA